MSGHWNAFTSPGEARKPVTTHASAGGYAKIFARSSFLAIPTTFDSAGLSGALPHLNSTASAQAKTVSCSEHPPPDTSCFSSSWIKSPKALLRSSERLAGICPSVDKIVLRLMTGPWNAQPAPGAARKPIKMHGSAEGHAKNLARPSSLAIPSKFDRLEPTGASPKVDSTASAESNLKSGARAHTVPEGSSSQPNIFKHSMGPGQQGHVMLFSADFRPCNLLTDFRPRAQLNLLTDFRPCAQPNLTSTASDSSMLPCISNPFPSCTTQLSHNLINPFKSSVGSSPQLEEICHPVEESVLDLMSGLWNALTSPGEARKPVTKHASAGGHANIFARSSLLAIPTTFDSTGHSGATSHPNSTASAQAI